MRIGVFTGKIKNPKEFGNLLNNLGDSLAGYSAQYPLPIAPQGAKFQPYAPELLAGCDAVLAFPSDCIWDDVYKQAMRRGLHLYISDFTVLSYQLAKELERVRQEVDCVMAFGNDGADVQHLLQNKIRPIPLFTCCVRHLPPDISWEEAKQLALYDIATMVKVSPSNPRKLMASSYPIGEEHFKQMSFRCELSNGSTLAYSVNRLSPAQSIHMEVIDNSCEGILSFSPQEHLCTYTKAGIFAEEIKTGKQNLYSGDQVLDSLSIWDQITFKTSTNK